MSIDSSLNKTEESLLGPNVILRRLIYDQETGERWEEIEMPAFLAVMSAIWDVENGLVVRRAIIRFNGVVDMWGSSF